jgi:hypothetical protein
MSIAAKVREQKERHPERFCTDPRCLWRVETRDGFKPCPKHSARVIEYTDDSWMRTPRLFTPQRRND